VCGKDWIFTDNFHELRFKGVPSICNTCHSGKNRNVQLFRLAEGIASCGSSVGPATHLHRFGTADVQLVSLACASSKLREMRQSHVTLGKVTQLPQKFSKLCQIIRCHIQKTVICRNTQLKRVWMCSNSSRRDAVWRRSFPSHCFILAALRITFTTWGRGQVPVRSN